jgi:hypothetical protein
VQALILWTDFNGNGRRFGEDHPFQNTTGKMTSKKRIQEYLEYKKSV